MRDFTEGNDCMPTQLWSGSNSFLYVLRIHHQNKCTCSFRNWQAGPSWNILLSLSLSLSLFFFPPLLLLPPPPPFPPPPSPTSSSFSSLFSPPPSPLSSPPPLDPSQCWQAAIQPAQYARSETRGKILPSQPGRGRTQMAIPDYRWVHDATLK